MSPVFISMVRNLRSSNKSLFWLAQFIFTTSCGFLLFSSRGSSYIRSILPAYVKQSQTSEELKQKSGLKHTCLFICWCHSSVTSMLSIVCSLFSDDLLILHGRGWTITIIVFCIGIVFSLSSVRVYSNLTVIMGYGLLLLYGPFYTGQSS